MSSPKKSDPIDNILMTLTIIIKHMFKFARTFAHHFHPAHPAPHHEQIYAILPTVKTTHEPPKQISEFRTVITSSLVSVGDVTLSLIVAAITGSSVMFAQGLQGVADLVTTSFLLLGVKQSKRAASPTHPFGYGRELFFWVLIASLFAFLFSGGLAVVRSVDQILHGSAIDSTIIALGTLAFGTITNGYSLSNSIRRLAHSTNNRTFWTHLRHSSLVETNMTLLVDLMGTLSAVLGLCALGLYLITGDPVYDGLGALIIGLLTATGALFVMIDLHDLIVGRSPHPTVIEHIRKTALRVHGVQDVLDLRAVSIGSGRILVILEIHFADNLSTDEIEQITDAIKERVIKAEVQVTRVQVEAETPDS